MLWMDGHWAVYLHGPTHGFCLKLILFKKIILFGVHLKIMSQLTIPNDVIEELKRT